MPPIYRYGGIKKKKERKMQDNTSNGYGKIKLKKTKKPKNVIKQKII
jgi:hypothetical protein